MKKGSRRYKNWKTEGFPGWLQQRMEERGWNALRLSREIGVVPSLVSRWMSDYQQPSPESLRAIAEAMQLSETEVLVAAGHLSAAEAPPDDPRRMELLRKMTAIALSHERYLTLNTLLNMMLEESPGPAVPETLPARQPSRGSHRNGSASTGEASDPLPAR